MDFDQLGREIGSGWEPHFCSTTGSVYLPHYTAPEYVTAEHVTEEMYFSYNAGKASKYVHDPYFVN